MSRIRQKNTTRRRFSQKTPWTEGLHHRSNLEDSDHWTFKMSHRASLVVTLCEEDLYNFSKEFKFISRESVTKDLAWVLSLPVVKRLSDIPMWSKLYSRYPFVICMQEHTHWERNLFEIILHAVVCVLHYSLSFRNEFRSFDDYCFF